MFTMKDEAVRLLKWYLKDTEKILFGERDPYPRYWARILCGINHIIECYKIVKGPVYIEDVMLAPVGLAEVLHFPTIMTLVRKAHREGIRFPDEELYVPFEKIATWEKSPTWHKIVRNFDAEDIIPALAAETVEQAANYVWANKLKNEPELLKHLLYRSDWDRFQGSLSVYIDTLRIDLFQEASELYDWGFQEAEIRRGVNLVESCPIKFKNRAVAVGAAFLLSHAGEDINNFSYKAKYKEKTGWVKPSILSIVKMSLPEKEAEIINEIPTDWGLEIIRKVPLCKWADFERLWGTNFSAPGQIEKVFPEWEREGFPAIKNRKKAEIFTKVALSITDKATFEKKYGTQYNAVLLDETKTSSVRFLNLMDGNDLLAAFSLGRLTTCCQEMGDVGETAMAYGLQYGGFLVIEHKGLIKAQSECWISGEGALVLDNIEIAHSAPITHIEADLLEWVEKSKFQDIILGLGYSKIRPTGAPKAPIPKFGIDADYQVYTDTKAGCVWLKKSGVSWPNL